MSGIRVRCHILAREAFCSPNQWRAVEQLRGDNSANDDVFVHPQGLCESEAVGVRHSDRAFAHVLEGAEVGCDCNIGDGSYGGGGAVVGDRVTIKNQVMIFERVTVDDDVVLGPGVTANDLNPRVSAGWVRVAGHEGCSGRNVGCSSSDCLRHHDRASRLRRDRGSHDQGRPRPSLRGRQCRPAEGGLANVVYASQRNSLVRAAALMRCPRAR